MPIERATLVEAISASGGAVQPDDQVDGLLAKLRAMLIKSTDDKPQALTRS